MVIEENGMCSVCRMIYLYALKYDLRLSINKTFSVSYKTIVVTNDRNGNVWTEYLPDPASVK